jgi:hypothetical protein
LDRIIALDALSMEEKIAILTNRRKMFTEMFQRMERGWRRG